VNLGASPASTFEPGDFAAASPAFLDTQSETALPFKPKPSVQQAQAETGRQTQVYGRLMAG
jgi:hypothetical protein